MEIKGKTALVTGGASGLGAAAVRRIVAAGGNAVILDVQEEKGKNLASELGKAALFCRGFAGWNLKCSPVIFAGGQASFADAIAIVRSPFAKRATNLNLTPTQSLPRERN